ncbi:MAG TPA: alpha/beta hydrolase [Terriglobia bacterium]|nr:alpha/beta hydrolase [Terriglobia bacterium]
MSASVLEREVSLDFAAQGRRLGVPVILLHGLTDSRRSFDRIMARLPASIYAVAVSLRGHGDSDRPEKGYAPSDFAGDIAALMDQLELQEAVIVGHSMGAAVAQRFAIDFPERTRGLVLAGSFFSLKDHFGVLELWESTVSRLDDPIDPLIVHNFQLSTITKSVPAAFLDAVVRESLKVPARVWKATLRALIETDFTRELRNIQAPTMLLWGDQDALVGAGEQDRLLAAIPGSRLNVYTGIGHAPHWEDPARFAADIADFAFQ